MAGLSPMMTQYVETKKQYPDCILFYRLGDFYEMFFEDALTASKELEITLTGKECGLEERAPMCGVPYHAVDSYLYKLVQKGYKVGHRRADGGPQISKGTGKTGGDPCGHTGNHYQQPGTGRDEKQLPDGHCLYWRYLRPFPPVI